MKKIFFYLFITALIGLTSCSKEHIEKDVSTKKISFIVQGHSYDISKSSIGRINPSTSLKSASSGDPSFSMDSIKFWIGSGSNKAAMVIEWHDNKGPDALVWGYRWDGDAYGFDMIREIVKAEPRLIFLTHMTGPMGYTIAGLGYDINKNGRGYLIYDNNVNEPQYPRNGIVYTNAYNYDKWTYSDPIDHWRSGWYKGYWSYWVKDSQKDTWTYSNLGASSRKLVNGCWDGWSFLDDMSKWEGKPLGNKFKAAYPN